MDTYDRIRAGLEEAIAYEKGTLKASTTKWSVAPIHHFEASEIRAIRQSTGLTQDDPAFPVKAGIVNQ